MWYIAYLILIGNLCQAGDRNESRETAGTPPGTPNAVKYFLPMSRTIFVRAVNYTH